MSEFVPVGKLKDFREGRGTVVKLGGVRVAVFNVGGRLHALQDACPHMGASLADGHLHGADVICHWHHWRFNLETGQGDQRSWACAQIFEVKVEDETVYLRQPDPPQPQRRAREEEAWIAWDPSKHIKPKSDGS